MELPGSYRARSEMNETSVMYAVPRRLMRWPAMTWPVCALSILFLLSLPVVNPYVHGDGVGYYAYAQSLVIDHDLNFEDDWRAATPGFLKDRVDANGQLLAEEYTVTGRLRNHFSVGPTILWAPFLTLAHAGVIVANSLGAEIPANGYSRPYLAAMASATVLYGFLGLLEAAAAMAAFFFVLRAAGWHYGEALADDNPVYLQATTACLSAIIVMQVVNVFLCRSERGSVFARGVMLNRLILLGIAVEIALILFIDYTPWGNSLFGTAPLAFSVWLYVVPFALAMLLFEELRKALTRRL